MSLASHTNEPFETCVNALCYSDTLKMPLKLLFFLKLLKKLWSYKEHSWNCQAGGSEKLDTSKAQFGLTGCHIKCGTVFFLFFFTFYYYTHWHENEQMSMFYVCMWVCSAFHCKSVLIQRNRQSCTCTSFTEIPSPACTSVSDATLRYITLFSTSSSVLSAAVTLLLWHLDKYGCTEVVLNSSSTTNCKLRRFRGR